MRSSAVIRPKTSSTSGGPRERSLLAIACVVLLAASLPANAAVTALDAWTNVLTNTTPNTISYTTTTASTFTMSAGTNRVALVGVCLETAAVTTISTIDVRLDSSTGTQFTQIVRSTGSQREQCYLGRLLDAQFVNGTHPVYLNVTMAGSTISGVHIWAGTYQGVDQTTPVTASAGNNSALANVTFGTNVAYNANSMSAYIVAGGNTATAVAHVAGFTSAGQSWSTDQSTSIAQATSASAGTWASTSTVTWTGASARSAIAVASLNPVSVSPPGAPGTPTYSNIATTSVTVSWAPATGATSYNLQRDTSNTFPAPTTFTGVTSPYNDAGPLTGDTTYWYRVVAVNAGGSTTGTGSSVLTLPDVAGAPTYSSIAQTTLTVSWTPPTGGATSYNLQRATDSAFTLNLVTVNGVTSPYGATGLTANTTYWFRAVSVNASGSTNGTSSSVTTLPNAPGAPGTPTYSNIASTSVTVSWTSGTGATSHNLQRATDSAFTLNLVTLTSVTSPYPDSGLTASTTYWYRAVAVNSGGSTTGTGSSVTTLAPENRVFPGVPTATANSCSQVTVSAPFTGDANGNSTTTFARGAASNGPFTNVTGCVGLTGASPRTCVDTTVAESSTYYYQATFTDTIDGVVGANPQVTAPVTTPACAANNTTIGTISAVNSSCNSIVATATFTGDTNNSGTTAFEYNTSNTWPGTSSCTVSGASPRVCTITGLVSPNTYWVRATFTDGDGVVGTNPTAGVSTGAALPACAGDTMPPTVTIISPARNAIVGGTETVKVQAFDAVAMNATPVLFSVDGGPLSATGVTVSAAYNCDDSSAPGKCKVYLFGIVTTSLTNGAHYFTVRAVDAANNATSLSWGFRVNNTGTTAAGTGQILRRSKGSQLCQDCHALETHSSQYTSTNYGNWSFDCLGCHSSHNTTSIYLVKPKIDTPNSGSKPVDFRNTTGVATNSYGTPQASGNGVNVCEVCHTRTQNSDATTRARNNAATDWTKHYTSRCTGCHTHKGGFAAGESSGGVSCSGCHSSIWNKMQATGGSTYKHTLALSTPTDDSVTWASPLNANAASARSCVNTCHNDHPHTATDDPSPTLHYNLAYDDATSNASRAATTRTVATKAKTDFDNSLANGGLCVSCHRNPVEAAPSTHPAVVQASYAASAHNTTSITTYTPGAAATHRATTTPVTGTTATLTINKPAGTVQGDLMIANIAWSTGTTNNSNPPALAGWTLLTDVDGTSTNPYRHAATLWKLAGASEGASYAFLISGTASAWVVTGTISTFTGTDQTTPIDVKGTHQWNNTASTTNTAPGITTATNNDLVVFFSDVGAANITHSNWTTASAGAMTQIYNSGLSAAMNVGAATVVDATAGATGNGTVTLSASAVAAGVLMAVHPTVTPSTTNWAYTLHDTSSFARNCTKCHWDSANGTTPTASGSAIGGVHGSSNPSLLFGTTNPAAAPASFVCYRCHGGGTTGADYSNKPVYQDGTKTYKHPMDADTVHVSSTEFNNAAWGNTLGVTGRHANCLDCHEPHAAAATIKKGTATTGTTTTTLIDASMSGRWTASQWVGSILYVPSLASGQNTRNITASTATGQLTVAAMTGLASGAVYYILDNKADTPLQGAWGAQFGGTLALWTAPATGNFTKKTIVAGSDLEATLCLKCHSNYYWGAGAPPNGLSANGTITNPVETDVAMEFNPANRSGHPVLASLNNFSGSTTPKPLAAAQMVAPWNVNIGTQTMSCTDCHNTDAGSPAAQGPHGSAANFMLKNGTAKPGWPTAVPTAAGFATTMCSDCHVNANIHGRDTLHTSNACYRCHIVVPHGGKMSRLVGSNATGSTMPARYAYSNSLATMYVTQFTKAASDSGYSTSNCGTTSASGCTGGHPTANGTESW